YYNSKDTNQKKPPSPTHLPPFFGKYPCFLEAVSKKYRPNVEILGNIRQSSAMDFRMLDFTSALLKFGNFLSKKKHN
ncbi:MAG TPA: hypothetical protein VFM79_04735, partial [Pelobium sp.]|nr:hypothetical protein [Pelobium sp.]